MTEKSVSEKPKKTKKSQEKSNKNFIDISTLKKDKEYLQDRKYREYILNKIDEFNNNGKLTIAYFCDTFYPIIDGVIKVLDNYASLLKDKYNIVVIVPKHKNIVIKKDYLIIGVSSLYFKFVNYDLAFPEIDGFLDKAIKRLKIDLVHSHSPFNMGAYAAKVAKKKKVPLVMTMHSQFKQDFLKYTNSEAISSYLLKQIVKVFNKSQEVWTMNERTKNVLESYGYNGKFYLLPNGTDFVTPDNLSELQSKANKKFKSKIKKYNLEDNVIFTGRISNREDLATIFARSNLFLFPSIYDMSSLVQIEAAAFKTPTIFIENSVTSASVTNNVNGFTASSNENEFANRVCELIDNRSTTEKVGEKAFEDLYKTWDQIAIICAERYEYLIKQNKNKQAKLTAIKNAKIFK